MTGPAELTQTMRDIGSPQENRDAALSIYPGDRPSASGGTSCGILDQGARRQWAAMDDSDGSQRLIGTKASQSTPSGRCCGSTHPWLRGRPNCWRTRGPCAGRHRLATALLIWCCINGTNLRIVARAPRLCVHRPNCHVLRASRNSARRRSRPPRKAKPDEWLSPPAGHAADGSAIRRLPRSRFAESIARISVRRQSAACGSPRRRAYRRLPETWPSG